MVKCPGGDQLNHFTALFPIIYRMWLQGTHASRLNVIVPEKSSSLRRYKTSILLGCSGTCCFTNRENENENFSGCTRTAGSNLIIFSTYCDSEFDLLITVQTNTQSDFPLVLKNQMDATYCKKNNRQNKESGPSVQFHFSSERYETQRN